MLLNQHQVLQGAAAVSMVKLVLQIMAEVLNCMVLPQRDNERLDKCLHPAVQDQMKVSTSKPVLHSTAKVNTMKLALHNTPEMNEQKQVLQSTVMVSR